VVYSLSLSDCKDHLVLGAYLYSLTFFSSFCWLFNIFILLIIAHLSLFFPVPKGGWEPTDRTLEAAAQREAVEEGPAFVLCARCALALYDPSLFQCFAFAITIMALNIFS
jgi:hypothetical protein